jgi:hypothetical protein
VGWSAVDAGFSRAARIALAGLILPQAALSLAASLGLPLRAGVWLVLSFTGVAGFGAAGAMAGASLARGRRTTGGFAFGFLLAGCLVVPAMQSLQGLSGREPVAVVSGFVISAFGAGFGLAGFAGSTAAGLSRALGRRLATKAALSGAAGGIIALGPSLLMHLRLSFSGAAYLTLLVAVVSFLSCIIVPFRSIGRAIDSEVGPPPPQPGLGLFGNAG